MRLCLLSFAVLIPLLACSEEASDASGAGAAAGSGAGGAGSGGGTTTGAGGLGGNVEVWGVIGVTNLNSGIMTDESHLLSAVFFDTLPNPNACTDEVYGDCTVSHCGADVTNVSELTMVEIGDISIGDGTQTAMLLWDGDGYPTTHVDGHFFVSGDTIDVSATGSSTFPAFDTSVTGPAAIMVDSASLPADISQSSQLDVNWTGSGSGEVSFLIQTPHNVGGERVEGVYIACHVPVSNGSLTVPAAAMSQLLPTSSTNCPGDSCDENTATVSIATLASDTVDLDTHVAIVRAAHGVSYSGGQWPGPHTVVP
jgi:hypothetical protein